MPKSQTIIPSSDGGDQDTPDKILVPLDGSPLAEKALTVAEEMAAALKVEVLIVQAALPVRAAIVAADEDVSPNDEKSFRDGRLDEYMQQVATNVRESGHKVQYELWQVPVSQELIEETGAKLRDLVAQQIVDRAKKPDVKMIVMATHGQTASASIGYGGVAARVMAACTKPVLLVRVLP